ncbi:MAG: hypothetical protein HEEMFOPI_01358 [Holosporales bacterium]
MQYFIVDFSEISPKKWDDFVESHPQSFLWHTYDFIIAKNSWRNHSHKSFSIVDIEGNIVAILPLHNISYKRFKILNKSTFENLGGWLCIDDTRPLQVLIKEYIKRLENKKVTSGSLNFSTASLAYNEDPFFLQGLSSYTARINVLNLSSGIETLWFNIRKGHKADIKKAERCGITFKKANSEDLDVYYDMHTQVYKKSSLLSHNRRYFEYIFNIAIPRNHAFIGMAYHDGRPIAAVNYGIYKNNAVYWTGACYEEAYKFGANHFLHWQMIQALYNRGIEFLDMGEVFFNHPSLKIQGIVNFKRGFGGDLRPCYKSVMERK